MKFRPSQFLTIILVILFSCNTANERRKADIGDISIERIKISRYEKALFNIGKSNLKTGLKNLQPQFPMFLDGDLEDSLNFLKIRNYLEDTLIVSVYNDCQLLYPDLSALEEELTSAFRYCKYYYPNTKTPDVYTYVSGFDYEYPVQFFDHHLLIAIDMYLGADYHRYRNLGLANYVLRRFSKEYIVRDCFFAIAHSQIDQRKTGTALLDLMLSEGKKIWLAGIMQPELPGNILFDYSKNQWQWAKQGEATVWAFLIENEMLYSGEMQAVQKFISDGPFTSYFGAESPPRLGTYIGWKIISSYMDRHPEITAEQLIKNYNAQEILNQSGYKPSL
jgi:hypothetical protein